ncbi:hypothetical protein ACFSCX_06755 [Bacillus salitolerans]|uniref:Uncharacterized protein n=1 Tax=Bacillus salitolerans TaxID=1437434 RepID=A0ABW4LM95_9BACI
MNFSIEKLCEELQKYKKKEESLETEQLGFPQVVKYVWEDTSTTNIDFDSFTIEDVNKASYELAAIPLQWDDGGENFTCDPTNAYMQYHLISEVLWTMLNTEQKRYLPDKDDFFI